MTDIDDQLAKARANLDDAVAAAARAEHAANKAELASMRAERRVRQAQVLYRQAADSLWSISHQQGHDHPNGCEHRYDEPEGCACGAELCPFCGALVDLESTLFS